MSSRDFRWLSYFQNVAVAARAVIRAVVGVQVVVDLAEVVVEVVEVAEAVIAVAVADLGVVMAVVVPTEVTVVLDLLVLAKRIA